MNQWSLRLLLLGSGAIFPLALAPFFYWPLGLLSLAGFVYGVQKATTTRQAFFYVWLFSTAKFLVGVSWIYVSMNRFGGTPAPLAALMVLIFAMFLAIFPAFVFAMRQRLCGAYLSWLTIPAFWVFYECLRGNFLTGFPWLFAGDAHLFSYLSGWAPLIGSHGISFLCVLTITVLFEVYRSKRYALLGLLIIWPIGAFLKPIEWTQPVGELNVSAVQGNVPQNLKWKPEILSSTIATYYRETSQHWDSDLILWPETAVPLVLDQFRPYMDDINDEAQEHNTTIITGIPYRYPRRHALAGEYHNSVVAFGYGEGLYHKQKLVPFGEFVPLERTLRGLIPFFDLEMSGFLHGAADQPLLKVGKKVGDTEQLYLIAPFICYEIAYPQMVAHMAKNADLLVTVSNDAWFGDSLGPKQHMALAQMRALETGRWLLRATNTGTTALVDHKGNIIERLPYETLATLTGVAQLRSGSTPYMILGVWPLLALCSIISVAAIIFKRRSSV